MLMRSKPVDGSTGGSQRRRSWPYVIASVALALGAVGLVMAPIGGAVYLALPGIALATWFAFIDASPFRIVLAVSATAFIIGLATGMTGLYLAAAGWRDFGTQESGFLLGAVALWGLPLIGLVLGAVGLVGVHFRPGVPDSAWHRDDLEAV